MVWVVCRSIPARTCRSYQKLNSFYTSVSPTYTLPSSLPSGWSCRYNHIKQPLQPGKATDWFCVSPPPLLLPQPAAPGSINQLTAPEPATTTWAVPPAVPMTTLISQSHRPLNRLWPLQPIVWPLQPSPLSRQQGLPSLLKLKLLLTLG